jgi:hypothetical protein
VVVEKFKMSDVVTPAERQEITELVSPLITAARTFEVVTHAGYAEAGSRLKTIKGAQKRLADKKAALVNPVNATLKAIRDLFRGPEEELVQAEGLYKRSMIAFDDEQEEIRRREQAKLDEIARKEREKNEAAAAKARQDAQDARAAGDDKKADRLEAKADVRQDAAATVVAATAQTEAPRVAGTSIRENWSATVTDRMALVQAIAAGTVPITAFEPNMKFLNNQAKAMKRELRYPGVTATVEKIMASGSA